MATIWLKILVAVDNTNKTIEARDATLVVEVDNLDGLKDHLIMLRGSWEKIWSEVEAVAEAMEIDSHHGFVGIRRSMGEITPETYKVNVFYKGIDNVLKSVRDRFTAIHAINEQFRFL